MNSSTHPDSKQLNAYIQDPLSEDYSQLRLHLIACMACREQASLLTDLKTHLPGIEAALYQQTVSESEELQNVLQMQLIEKFIDGQLSKTEQPRVEGIIQDNPQAMKAAMHYASHSARMPKEFGDDSGTIASVRITNQAGHQQPAKPGVLSILRRWLMLRFPIWLTVPVTAAITSILSIVFIPQLALDSSKVNVIAYQDNPVIQFKHAQDPPGIGFFANANKSIKPYAKITTRLMDENVVHLSWPKVDNAISYNMHRSEERRVGKECRL